MTGQINEYYVQSESAAPQARYENQANEKRQPARTYRPNCSGVAGHLELTNITPLEEAGLEEYWTAEGAGSCVPACLQTGTARKHENSPCASREPAWAR